MPETNPQINLDTPGELSTSADNAHDYMIWLTLANASYTPQAVQAQGAAAIAAGDVLATGGPYLANGGDDAVLHLKAFVEAMRPKLSADGKTPVKGIVLATPSDGSQDPGRRRAVVEDYTMLGPTVKVLTVGYNA